MKKSSKIAMFLLSIFSIFLLIQSVEANSIDKISMDIFIDNNGNARVTETWVCNTTEGTELYHPYYNLGKSKIRNLSVISNGIEYTTLSQWNTSGTLASKANKCGINNIEDGVEVCWGISKYGSHTYKVKYTITNFIAELNDSQMIYWTLIPHDFSQTIKQADIKIHTNFNISSKTEVWGYGNYGGTAYVYDGCIEMNSEGLLEKNEYMTILAKFPLGTFSTSNKINADFNYYYNMAEKGSTKFKEKTGDSFIEIISVIGSIIGMIFLSILGFAFSTKISNNWKSKQNFTMEKEKLTGDIPYFRDIACKQDIFRAYYIGNKYGLLKNKTDVLGAIILKWFKQSFIEIKQKDTGTIFKKENTIIVLNQMKIENLTDEKELDLFNMLYKASKDGSLESKEFEKWCRKNYSRLFAWFDNLLKREEKRLIEEGLIEVQEEVKYKIVKNKKYSVNSKLAEEAKKLAGLKRYLEDYTLIAEREAIEVNLFEDYLIYAQIMGIAKTVAKQFKEIYPEIAEQSGFYSFDYINFIFDYSDDGIKEANKSKARSDSYSVDSYSVDRARSYSAGGGGFSSGGGGGGSFGRGRGGGGIR